MKLKSQIDKVDIKTSHNIILSFPLATIGQRMGAYTLDLVMIWFTAIFVLSVFSDIVITYIVLVPLFFLYHLGCETFFRGQSLGKRLLKLRVVSLQSRDLDKMSILIRWAFRLLDIGVTFGLLGLFMMISSNRKQRLGDILARTAVISLSRTQHQTIKSLSEIEKIDHQITYPQVVAYNDSDMLIVKETLSRLRGNPSPEELAFAKSLAAKLDKELAITNRPKSMKTYFKTLIDDYVMASR